MEKGLLDKTGKPLAYWVAVVKDTGLQKHTDIINHLKSEHDFSHGYANFVSLKARQADAGSIDDQELIENQYKGKEALLPVYNRLLETIKAFGKDVSVVPKKDSVSLIRKKQFALIKPATKSRIDLGIKLKGVEPAGRLEGSGPFGTMVTHRVRLEDASDVDQELKEWLLEAYIKAE
jgi:hypothetical protein